MRDNYRFWVTFAVEKDLKTRACDFDVTLLNTAISPPQPTTVDTPSTMLCSDKWPLTAYSHDSGSEDKTPALPESHSKTRFVEKFLFCYHEQSELSA